MKKITALIVAAVMCLALTACAQKSQDVKNTEIMIKAIGTVTQDSGEDIVWAERFYNGLTDEEKGQVSNYNTLLQARSDYDEMIMYGQWVQYMTDKTSIMTLMENGSFEMSDGKKGTYEKTDNAVVLTCDNGETITLKKDVHMNLVHLVSDTADYIRPALLTEETEKIVSSSWYRFFNIPYHVHIEKDDIGLAEDFWNCLQIRPNEEYLPYLADVDVTLTLTYTTRDIAVMHNADEDNLLIMEELTEPVPQEVTVHLTKDSFANLDKCCDEGSDLARGVTSQYKDYQYLIKTMSYLENGDITSFEGTITYYNQLKDYYENK